MNRSAYIAALLVVAWFAAMPAFGQTLYKYVTPEGKVVYTDHPPTQGKLLKTITPDGMSAFAQAGGGRGVPLLLARGQRVQGFSPASYEQVFAK
jgi:hypothetical protein